MDSKTILLIVVIVTLLILVLFMCIFTTCSINKLEKENSVLYGMIEDLHEQVTVEQANSNLLFQEKIELLRELESLKNQPEPEPEEEIIEEEVKEPDEKPGFYDLTGETTNMLCWMDYRKITNTASMQYKIQEECVTSSVYGIRRYYAHSLNMSVYTVAMGSKYGRNLGDIFKVTLANDSPFYVMLAEFKDDGITNPSYPGHPCKNYDGEDCTNVIEFIVDEGQISPSVKHTGTFTALETFGGLHGSGGNIKTIEYIGHADF
jgi:hypothetical protein